MSFMDTSNQMVTQHYADHLKANGYWEGLSESDKEIIRQDLQRAERFAIRVGLSERPWQEHISEHGKTG